MDPLLEMIYQGLIDNLDENVKKAIMSGTPSQNLALARKSLTAMREERDKFRDAAKPEAGEALGGPGVVV